MPSAIRPSITAPLIVRAARTPSTRRSPRVNAAARSRRSRCRPATGGTETSRSPGRIAVHRMTRRARRPRQRARASRWCRDGHARAALQRAHHRSGEAHARRRVTTSEPAVASVVPLGTAATSTPVRFTAAREGDDTSLTVRPCTCRPRTRTSPRPGNAVSVSPVAIRPETSVPVTTVPKPLSVNARSTGNRTSPGRSVRARSGGSAASARRNASSPPRCARRRARLARRRARCRRRAHECRAEPARWPARPRRRTSSHDHAAIDAKQTADPEVPRVCGLTDSVALRRTARPRCHPHRPACAARTARDRARRRVTARLSMLARKPEIDRDAARLPSLQAIDRCRSALDERALAVIDAPCRHDEHAGLSGECAGCAAVRAGPTAARLLAGALLLAAGRGLLRRVLVRFVLAVPSGFRPPRIGGSAGPPHGVEDPVRPRSICRRSRSTRITCTRTRSPGGHTAVLLARRMRAFDETGSSRRPSSRRAPCLRRRRRLIRVQTKGTDAGDVAVELIADLVGHESDLLPLTAGPASPARRCAPTWRAVSGRSSTPRRRSSVTARRDSRSSRCTTRSGYRRIGEVKCVYARGRPKWLRFTGS